MEMIVAKLWRLISEEPFQYLLFLSLSGIVLILTGIAYSASSTSFQKYFGRIYPLAVVFVVFILGLILFAFLLLDGQFAIYRGGNFKGIVVAVGLAVPLAAIIILVDRRSPFPVDMNVAYPASLFFYPAIGYVVELLFHILPFCLLYFILGFLTGESGNTRIIWASILTVALIEPIFQVVFTAGGNTNWVVAYVGLHLFLFNFIQLLLFRRYDFITMYSFRLSYYFLWHIIWGHLRLKLLF